MEEADERSEQGVFHVCPRYYHDGEDEWFCQLEQGHPPPCQHHHGQWVTIFHKFDIAWLYLGGES